MALPARAPVRAAFCFLTGIGFAVWPLRFAGEAEESSRWLLFTGSFHPLVLHLPIGIVIAIAAFEIWTAAARRNESTLRHFLWFAAAVSASVSFVTGYVLGAGGGHDATLLERHLWLAGGFTALCWISLGLLLLRDTAIVRCLTWAAAAAPMLATGHFGGLMVHGDPLANAPWRPDPTAIEILPPPGETVEVYADLVQPLLAAKCQSCHGPGKQNGRLRLDSIERALAGGSHGPALVPRHPKESRLLQTILLPLENEQHMPPKNRPQLNEAEIDLLHWWIQGGASAEMSLAASEAPAVIKPFLVPSYRLLPDRELLAQQQREEKRRREEEAQRRVALDAALAKIPVPQRAWFTFAGESSADLEFAVTTSPESFGDAQLAPLAELLRECARITLAGTKVTDEGLASLKLSSRVRELNLKHTQVTPRGLAALSGATNLEILNIYGTAVDGALAAQAPELPALRRLFVGETRLPEETIPKLRRKYPQTEIIGALILTTVAPPPPPPEPRARRPAPPVPAAPAPSEPATAPAAPEPQPTQPVTPPTPAPELEP